MKGDVDKIKTEMDGINDSIKNLLCVYEAVSREYNPFVDSEMPVQRSRRSSQEGRGMRHQAESKGSGT